MKKNNCELTVYFRAEMKNYLALRFREHAGSYCEHGQCSRKFSLFLREMIFLSHFHCGINNNFYLCSVFPQGAQVFLLIFQSNHHLEANLEQNKSMMKYMHTA